MYSQLGESKNQQGASFIATEEFIEFLNKNYTRVKIAEKTGLGINTIYSLYKQKAISRDCCDKIAKVLKISFKKNFTNPRVESFLSNKTIKHHHSLISAVLNKAVECQIIKENVAKYINPPKVIKTDIAFLNEERVQILLNELKTAPHQQGVMIKLFLLTGLGHGELCGLDWTDNDRLFTSSYGMPIHPDTVTGWFDKFIKRLDIPKVTVHGLRHTFISLLISKGIDIVTVADLAGHSQASTTVNMYAHSLQIKKVEANSEISDLIGF